MGFTVFVATLLTVAVIYTIILFPRYRLAERMFLEALDGSRRSSGALPRRGEEWARRWALEPYYRWFAGAIDLGRHQVDPALEGLRQRARFLKSVWLWGLWPIAFATASLATIVISSPQPSGLIVPILIASVAATVGVAIKLRATRPRDISRH